MDGLPSSLRLEEKTGEKLKKLNMRDHLKMRGITVAGIQ